MLTATSEVGREWRAAPAASSSPIAVKVSGFISTSPTKRAIIGTMSTMKSAVASDASLARA